MASERDIDKPDPKTSQDGFELGVFAKRDEGMPATDKIALALTLIWLAGIVVFFFALRPQISQTSSGPLLTGLFFLLGAFFPIAMIWIGASVVRSARAMRTETARLHSSMASMRAAYDAQQKPKAEASAKDEALPPIPLRRSRMIRFDPPPEAPSGGFVTAATAPPAPPENDGHQASLALDAPAAQTQPLAISDFIGALNFPEDDQDVEGFERLKKALTSPHSAKLVRAAQDMLTLLSKDGLYMDDLVPDRAKPELWRAFAQGDRGARMGAIGGIRRPEALAMVANQMRLDPVYRDAAHHFLREFDHTFARFAKVASDAEISRLTETRSARAFMLISRAIGVFD